MRIVKACCYQPPVAEGEEDGGVQQPHGIHHGGTPTETRMINVERGNLWAYPHSIDNSDRSPGKGRNSLHNVDRATTRGSRNSHIWALQIAWWVGWRYSPILKTVLWGQMMMIILWSRVDPPWRKAINLSSLVLGAICCASNWTWTI